jgi:hypothetical protein
LEVFPYADVKLVTNGGLPGVDDGGADEEVDIDDDGSICVLEC